MASRRNKLSNSNEIIFIKTFSKKNYSKNKYNDLT